MLRMNNGKIRNKPALGNPVRVLLACIGNGQRGKKPSESPTVFFYINLLTNSTDSPILIKEKGIDGE